MFSLSKKGRRVLAVLLPLLLFAGLAFAVQSGFTVAAEAAVYRWIAGPMSPALTGVLRVFTEIGGVAGISCICLGLLLWPQARRTVALPAISAVLCSVAANLLLKSIFQRERPSILRLVTETDYSFPSGHAMNNAALYTVLLLLLLYYIRPSLRRRLLAVVCVLMPLIIGVSRIYLGVHHAGDVLGGWLLGADVGLAVYLLWSRRTPGHRNQINR